MQKHESATAVKLFPMPLSTLEGLHPDSRLGSHGNYDKFYETSRAKRRRGPIAVLQPGMQHTYRITISRFGCNTIAKFHSFSPEQDAKGHSVQLSWTPMGIIYCIAKEVPTEFCDMMHS